MPNKNKFFYKIFLSVFVLVFVASGFFIYDALADEHWTKQEIYTNLKNAVFDGKEPNPDFFSSNNEEVRNYAIEVIRDFSYTNTDSNVRVAAVKVLMKIKCEVHLKREVESLISPKTEIYRDMLGNKGDGAFRGALGRVIKISLEKILGRFIKSSSDEITEYGLGQSMADLNNCLKTIGSSGLILKTLKNLPEDTSITISDLAAKTGLSREEVTNEVKKLQEAGFYMGAITEVQEEEKETLRQIEKEAERERAEREAKNQARWEAEKAETQKRRESSPPSPPSAWERLMKDFKALSDGLKVSPGGLGGLGEIPSGLVQPLGPDYFQQPFLLPPPDSSLIPKPQSGSGSSFVPEPLPISYSPGSDLMTLPEFMTNLEKVFNLFGDKLSVINNPQTDSKTRTEAISTALRAKLVIFKALQTLVDSLLGKKEGQFKGQVI